MGKAFIQSLYKNLIRYRDFMPLQDEKGEIYFADGIPALLKDAYGSLLIAELIDGDRTPAEEMAARLEANHVRLMKMQAAQYHSVLEIFVFDRQPEPEKVNIIINKQFQNVVEKKFLVCMSVELEARKVVRHFHGPASSFGLDRFIRKQLAAKQTSRDMQMKPAGQAEQIDPITLEDIKELVRQREEENRLQLRAKTSTVTYSLIAVNILVWVAINLYSLLSGLDINQLLIDFGAKENMLIISGQYWRFVTPVFLHANLMHLVLNCYSLYAVGTDVEKLFGHLKFAVVYFLAGILGNIASFMFSTSSGVGASGAIFGLMGALLYLGLEKPLLFKRYFGYNVIIAIAANLAYGFSRTGIDNYAHLGGLFGGFLASGAVKNINRPKWYLNRYLYILLITVITFAGVFYGITNKQNTILRMVIELEQQYKSENWNEAERMGEAILNMEPADLRVRVSVLWTLVRAEALSGKFDEGVEHAEQLQRLDPPDGHYLLGLLYFDMEQYELSRQELLEARRLQAGYKNIDELLAQIDKLINKK